MNHVHLRVCALCILLSCGATPVLAEPPAAQQLIHPAVDADALRRELPPYPGYEWRRCGQDLMLVEVATRIVADVLAGIFE